MNELAAFSLFETLGADELQTLREYLDERRYARSAIVFREGEESVELLLLLEGRVQLDRSGRVLGELHKGDVLGGIGLVRVGQHECNASVSEPVRALVLDRVSYHRLRTDSPGAALALQDAILRDFASSVSEVLTSLVDAPGQGVTDGGREVDGEDLTQ